MVELGAQIRAARALLGWSQETLAVKASISVATVKRVEAGGRNTPVILKALQSTMEEEGVVISSDLKDLEKISVEIIIAKIKDLP